MAKAKLPPPPATFEAALQELETIVRAMEAGDGPLDESLAAYDRGMTLLKRCRETLAAAEQRLQVLENDALADFAPTGAEGTEG
jgi:exodeoxyribonuclease VII small subunit